MMHMMQPLPLDLRVLATLATGASSPARVAAQVGQSQAVVVGVLDQAVGEQLVQRLDLGDAATYSLTPTGLEAVGVVQGVQGAIDGTGHVDLGEATRMVARQYLAARDMAAEDAVREQAGWAADDSSRDRVTSALADAYARGSLTKEELDNRTSAALAARTMGDLRAAGRDVMDLPPTLQQGGHLQPSSGASPNWQPHVYVNPRLNDVNWGPVGTAAGLALIGLLALTIQPLAGLGLIALAVVIGAVGIRRRSRS
jgi:hypothetical protein